jgi:cytochrome c2
MRSWLALSLALGAVACRERGSAKEDSRFRASETVAPSPPIALVAASGDATRGASLVREFECNRCHEGTGAAAPPLEKNCTGCHTAILSGKLGADSEARERWQSHIHHFVTLPALGTAKDKFRSSWVARFLLEPHDLRPGLEETMPRLGLSLAQARDIAAHLAPLDASEPERPPGDLERGRRLLETKGCGTCHRMSGVPALHGSPLAVHLDDARLATAIRLAPDLAAARERLLPGYVERWLARPSAVDPGALMPDIPLSNSEVRDIAAYILTTPLAAGPATEAPAKPFARLPLLTRPVLFAEVKARVFRHTCWHCHSDPDYAIGDGGPGNTGGFGFRGKGIDLAEHETILAGFVDENGARKSLFVPETPEGDNRLVRALLARHAEEAGRPVAGVRGMPLGLPALPAEEIQLIESWIAQGRPL